MKLTDLSTKELLDGMTALLGTERRAVARLVAYLAEVEARGAHLDAAYSSLHDFCIRGLGLSEGESFRRIVAARLVRHFPVIIAMLEEGSIHLSALVMLRDHLTDANHVELLREASRKTKSEIALLLASRFPRPDVQTTIRALSAVAGSSAAVQAPLPTATGRETQACRPAHVEPLSASRHRVEMTVSSELRAKLERAAQLMGHRVSDLARVMDRALDLLISALEKQRFGKTAREGKARGAKHGHITRAVRREVSARDGEQCAFVSESGERCSAREHLEYDHRLPRARGGSGDATNVRLLCRAHNLRAAELVFGKEHVAEQIRLRQRRRDRERSAVTAPTVPAPSPEGAALIDRASVEEASGARRRRSETAMSVYELAERALRTMGFRAPEAQVALRELRARKLERTGVDEASTCVEPKIEDILRSALALLR